MKPLASSGLCLLCGVAWSTSVLAAMTDGRANPYATIPTANVFRLKPLSPTNEPSDPQPSPPPPVITLQGITTLPCGSQVLFKVTLPAKPPEPAKVVALVLSEGEREGEIEVLRVNALAGTVTFRNHGIEQVLSLRK